jgi:hypothetical protein
VVLISPYPDPLPFQLFFSVQGTGDSPTEPDPENRVGDQDTGSLGMPVSLASARWVVTFLVGLRTYRHRCIYLYKRESSWYPNFGNCGTWSATVRPPHCLRYRPAVFFHHFHAIAISLLWGSYRLTFKKYHHYKFLLSFFFNCWVGSSSIWSEREGRFLRQVGPTHNT